jgi:glycosyltransferase involved in cell wall biosynthesis
VRVGLIIYGSLDTVSGGYLYDRQLVEHLARQGDDVDIISLPHRTYSRTLLDNLSPSLRQEMCRGYDVLLQDELNHPSLAWANGRLGRERPPLVAIVHHLRAAEKRPVWQNRLYRVVERRYLRSVDGYIYNSQATRAQVEALAGDWRPFVVAPPGGDRLAPAITEAEVIRRAAAGPLRLLFVGNLIPRKGLLALLEALARAGGDWRLRVAGSPTVDPAYARRAAAVAGQAGLRGRVAWLGALTDAQLAAEMTAAHVLAVPSAYEGFGIVYLEGMGFGLPALATTAGGAREIVVHGETGFLVSPDDKAALADAIERLAADRTMLARMGVAALARYQAHPTWEQTTAAMRAFLVTMANRHGVE